LFSFNFLTNAGFKYKLEEHLEILKTISGSLVCLGLSIYSKKTELKSWWTISLGRFARKNIFSYPLSVLISDLIVK
jgi:hypothetical protein